MTPLEAAAILRQHNAWRLDFDDVLPQVDPLLIGEAIDVICDYVEANP